MDIQLHLALVSNSSRNISVCHVRQTGIFSGEASQSVFSPLFVLVLLSSSIYSSWIIIEKWPLQGFSNVLPFSRTSPAPRGNCADWWYFKRGYRLYSPFLSRMVFAPPIPTLSFPHHRSLSLIHLFSLPNTNHWFFRGSIKYLRCVGRPLSMGIWQGKIIFKTKS